MIMEFTNFQAHQGDVQIFGVKKIPKGAKKLKKQFIAASEKSGHAHALCGDYEMYEVEEGFIIRVGTDGVTLNHTGMQNLTPEYWDKNQALPVADHNPTTLPEGTYLVGIQQRVDPFEGTWKAVKD